MLDETSDQELPPIIKPGVGVSLVRRKSLSDTILSANLRAFVTTVGWIVNYDFDERDWQFLSDLVVATAFDESRWCDFELLGSNCARLLLARGSLNRIHVKLDVPVELVAQSRLAIDIFSTFVLKKE